MVIPMLPAELRAAAPAVAVALAELLARLGALIARAFARHPRHIATILPLWNYLARTARRFARVMLRQEAGTLRAPSPRPGRASSGRPPLPFPRTHGWLLAELKHEGAYFAIRLEALLATPETAALIATTPPGPTPPPPHLQTARRHARGPEKATLSPPPRGGRRSSPTPGPIAKRWEG